MSRRLLIAVDVRERDTKTKGAIRNIDPRKLADRIVNVIAPDFYCLMVDAQWADETETLAT